LPQSYTLSLHDALPIFWGSSTGGVCSETAKELASCSTATCAKVSSICRAAVSSKSPNGALPREVFPMSRYSKRLNATSRRFGLRSEEHTSELRSRENLV